MVAYAQAEEDVEPETRNGDFYGAMYDQIHCIADLNETGSMVRSYTYGPGIDNPLAMTTYSSSETNSYYYLTDHLGSVIAITDEGGAIVERYHYDGWGRTTVSDGNGMPMDESAVGNRIAFQGREIAWATELYYFRARTYDPITGRWLSKDPIGIAGGLNQYVAFENNPISFRDPLGLETIVAYGDTHAWVMFREPGGSAQQALNDSYGFAASDNIYEFHRNHPIVGALPVLVNPGVLKNPDAYANPNTSTEYLRYPTTPEMEAALIEEMKNWVEANNYIVGGSDCYTFARHFENRAKDKIGAEAVKSGGKFWPHFRERLGRHLTPGTQMGRRLKNFFGNLSR